MFESWTPPTLKPGMPWFQNAEASSSCVDSCASAFVPAGCTGEYVRLIRRGVGRNGRRRDRRQRRRPGCGCIGAGSPADRAVVLRALLREAASHGVLEVRVELRDRGAVGRDVRARRPGPCPDTSAFGADGVSVMKVCHGPTPPAVDVVRSSARAQVVRGIAQPVRVHLGEHRVLALRALRDEVRST